MVSQRGLGVSPMSDWRTPKGAMGIKEAAVSDARSNIALQCQSI
jgi:hypothetical protein